MRGCLEWASPSSAVSRPSLLGGNRRSFSPFTQRNRRPALRPFADVASEDSSRPGLNVGIQCRQFNKRFKSCRLAKVGMHNESSALQSTNNVVQRLSISQKFHRDLTSFFRLRRYFCLDRATSTWTPLDQLAADSRNLGDAISVVLWRASERD